MCSMDPTGRYGGSKLSGGSLWSLATTGGIVRGTSAEIGRCRLRGMHDAAARVVSSCRSARWKRQLGPAGHVSERHRWVTSTSGYRARGAWP